MSGSAPRATASSSRYSHEGWEVSSRPDGYSSAAPRPPRGSTPAPNVWTEVSVVHADRNTPGYMRSPPEVPYIFALETAMDELAVKLGMDPIELRRINDARRTRSPACRSAAARWCDASTRRRAAFGWKDRDPRPGSMRDGDWLVGWGCATAVYPAQIAPATARVRLGHNGQVRGRDGGARDRQRRLDRDRPDRPREAGRAARQGPGRAGRQRAPARAGRGRLEHDRERLQRGDEGLRCDPRPARPRGGRRG